MFGLITKKKMQEQLKQARRQSFTRGRVLGYAEALYARIRFVTRPPDVIEEVEEILRNKESK